LKAKKCPNAKSRAKQITVVGPIEITHVIDIEGKETKDLVKFEKSLDSMRDAEKIGKKIKYKLAYSNISFEIWILLHKKNCCQSLSNINNYLNLINSSFDQKFLNLREYKKKDNFEKILNQLSLEDVKAAISRAKKIESNKKKSGLHKKQYKKYSYYLDNPATSVWEIVEKILTECKIY
jgi:DNA-binding protein H-NS